MNLQIIAAVNLISYDFTYFAVLKGLIFTSQKFTIIQLPVDQIIAIIWIIGRKRVVQTCAL